MHGIEITRLDDGRKFYFGPPKQCGSQLQIPEIEHSLELGETAPASSFCRVTIEQRMNQGESDSANGALKQDPRHVFGPAPRPKHEQQKKG